MILLVVISGVPLLFLRNTNDVFNTPKLALLMAGVALVSALRVIEVVEGSSWKGLEVLWVPAVAISIPLFISWLLSPYRGWSLFGLIGRYQGLLPYLIVILLGILVADSFRGRAEQLALGVVWSAALVGGYALVQLLGLDPYEWSLQGAPTRVISTLGNPNFTGGFLGMALPVAVAVWLSMPERRRLLARLLFLIVAGWLATRSQGGWAAGVSGIVVVAGALATARWKLGKFVGLIVAAVIGAGIVGSVIYSTMAPESRFASSAFEVRGRWWQAATAMGAEAPLIGKGPNSFAIEGVRHRPLDDALAFDYDFTNDPHSVPLSFFANGGVLGIAGFVLMGAWVIKRGLSIEGDRLLAVGFFGAATAYLIQSLVSIDEISLRATLWVALAGMTLPDLQGKVRAKAARGRRSELHKSGKAAGKSLRHPQVVAAITVVAIAAVSWPFLFLASDMRVDRGLKLISLHRVGEAEVEFQRVQSFREDGAYYALEAINAKREALESGTSGQSLFDLSTSAFRSYLDDVPLLYGITEHASLLDQWGEDLGHDSDEEAEALWVRAMAIDPLNPLIRMELAQIRLELGRPKAASDAIEPAAKVIGERFGQVWGTVALVRAELGQEAQALEALEMALRLSPSDPITLEAQTKLQRDE